VENGWGYCEESALLCTRNFSVLSDRSRHPILKFTESQLSRICVRIGTLSFASKNRTLKLGPFSARDGNGSENEFRSLVVFLRLWRHQKICVWVSPVGHAFNGDYQVLGGTVSVSVGLFKLKTAVLKLARGEMIPCDFPYDNQQLAPRAVPTGTY